MAKNKITSAFAFAFPHTLPVLAGYLILGLAYGILMDSVGYNAIWSTGASMITIAGGMQFLTVDFLTSAFNPLGAFVMAVMVNARHCFYSLSLLEKYNGVGKMKPFLIFSLSDEVFSVVSSVKPTDEVEPKWFYFAVTFLIWSYWAIGTALGGIIGGLVTFNTAGIDFVLPALFLVLLLEQLKDKKNWYSAIVGGVSTLLALLLVGETDMIILAMCFILVVFYIGRKKKCN